MPHCVVFNCNSRFGVGKKLSWFTFPKNQQTFREWVHYCNRQDFTPTKHSRMCSQHFTESQYSRHPERLKEYGYTCAKAALKDNAVPDVPLLVCEKQQSSYKNRRKRKAGEFDIEASSRSKSKTGPKKISKDCQTSSGSTKQTETHQPINKQSVSIDTMHCAALNCDVKTRQGISLFSFPDNEERRTVWIKNLKGGHDFELPEPARICANHFDDSQFVVNPQIAASVGFRQRSLRLKDDAIPTIFDHNYPVNPSAGKRKRKFRVRKAKLKRKKKEDWSSETDTCIEDSDSSDLYNPDDDEDFNTKMKCTGNKLDKIKVNKSPCPTESLRLHSDEEQVLAGDCKLGQYLGHKRQEEVDDNSTSEGQEIQGLSSGSSDEIEILQDYESNSVDDHDISEKIIKQMVANDNQENQHIRIQDVFSLVAQDFEINSGDDHDISEEIIRQMAAEDEDIQQNKHTVRKTKCDITMITKFIRSKNEERDILKIPPKELDPLLAEFILKGRKMDGGEFEPSSLKSIISSLDRYLHQMKYGTFIIKYSDNYQAFDLTRKTLKSKVKFLRKLRKGPKPKRLLSFTPKEIDVLYNKNVLGSKTPQALFYTLWLNNLLHFGLKSAPDHYNLRWGDVTLKTGEDGYRYLELNYNKVKRRCSTCDIKPKVIMETEGERNPIKMYEIYAQKRPENFSRPFDPFYLVLNSNTHNQNWFLRLKVGEKRLATVRKRIKEKGGLEINTGTKAENHQLNAFQILPLNIQDIETIGTSGKGTVTTCNTGSEKSHEQKKPIYPKCGSSIPVKLLPISRLAANASLNNDTENNGKHQMLKAKDGHTNLYNSLLVKKTVESPSTQKTSEHSTDRDTHNGSTNLVKPNSLNGSQQFGIPAQLPVFVQTNNTGTPQSVQKVSQLQLIGAPAQKVPQLQQTGVPAQKVRQLQLTCAPQQVPKVPQLQQTGVQQPAQKVQKLQQPVPQLQSTGAPAQKLPLQLRLVIENNPQLQTSAASSVVPALQPNTGTTPQSDSLTTLQSSIEMPSHIASGITQQSSIGTSPHSSTGTCNTPVDTAQERNIYFDKAQVQTRNTTRSQQKDAGCVLMFSKIPTFLNKFSDSLFSLQQAGMLCDVELKGKDSSVYAHRLILFASGSSRLKSMLSDIQHWKYSCITLDLSTFSSSILQSLVRYFYTGEVVIARKEVIDLWRLCEWLSLYDICKSLHPYCFFEIAGQVSTIRKPMNNAEQSSLDKKRVKTNKTVNNKTYKKDGVNHLLIKDALPEVLAEEKTPETCQDKKLSEKLKDIIKKNEELLQEMSSRSQNTFIMSKEQIMTHVRANSNASKNLKKRFGPVNDENFMKKTTESVRYQVQTIDNEMYMNSDIQARTVSGETSSVVESNVVTSGVEASNVVASTVAEQTYTMPNYEDTISELHRKTMDELGLSENSLTNIKTEPDYFMDEISSEMGLLTSLKTEDGVEYKIFENSDIQDESDTAEMQTHTAVTENNVENIPLENVVIKSEPLWE